MYGRSVPADEFGRAVNDDVCPVFQRSYQIRCGECVVNSKRYAVCVSDLREVFYVYDIAVRIT